METSRKWHSASGMIIEGQPSGQWIKYGYLFRPKGWHSAITALGAGVRMTTTVELFVLLPADVPYPDRWIRLKSINMERSTSPTYAFSGYSYQQIEPIRIRPDALYAVVVDCSAGEACHFEQIVRNPAPQPRNVEWYPAGKAGFGVASTSPWGWFGRTSSWDLPVGYADVEVTTQGDFAHPHGTCAVGAPLSLGRDPCVDAVCQSRPACCSGTWDAECVQQVSASCGRPCLVNSQVRYLEKRLSTWDPYEDHVASCLDVPIAGMSSGLQVQTYECNGTGAQAFQFNDKGSGQWEVRRNGTNLCLDVRGGVLSDGSALQQYTCNNSAAQRFILEPLSGGVQLRIAGTNLCVDAPALDNASNVLFRVKVCNRSDTQTFRVRVPVVKRINSSRNLCIDAPSSALTHSLQLQMWDCNDSSAQSWQRNDKGNGMSEFRRNSTGLCFDVPQNVAESGKPVTQYPCNGSAAQEWRAEPRGGGYQLRFRDTGLCVDIVNGADSPGAKLQLYPCNVTNAQIFGLDERRPVRRVALRAWANSRYVQVGDGGSSPLNASATAIGPWERFERLDNADGTFSLLSLQNARFVTAESGGNAPLIARALLVGPWEKFREQYAEGYGNTGYRWITSVANDKYVTLDSASPRLLIARATSTSGTETFFMESLP